MILTRKLLDAKYSWWFHDKRNAEQAKEELLKVFSQEPDDSVNATLIVDHCDTEKVYH